MTASNNFDKALNVAFAKSDQLDTARAQVTKLTHEFSRSVKDRTEGLVTIELLSSNPGSFGDLVKSVVGSLQRPEDQMHRWVVARENSGNFRVLWRVSFDKNQGYPVEVVEPDDETSHACYELDGLRDVFLELASAGTVGPKIKQLAAGAPRHVKQLVDALQDTILTGVLARRLRVDASTLQGWIDYLSLNDSILSEPEGDEFRLTKTDKLDSFTKPILGQQLKDGPPEQDAG